MALNKKPVNKIEYNGTTLIDLTSDTVTSDNLPLGVTAHSAAGDSLIGSKQFVESSDIETIVVSDTVPTVDDKTVLTLVITE